ncbi:MAG: tetratricopeptide repeat protein [bacterium]
MDFSWVLVFVLGFVLLVALFIVISQIFSEEKELMTEAQSRLAEGDQTEAVSLLNRVLDLNPANAQARWLLGKMLEMMGQDGQALGQYRYCLENNLLPKRVSEEKALVRLAESAKKAGETETAIEAWTKILGKSSDLMEPRFERGQLYYQLEQYEKALNDFKQIREDFDDYPQKIILYEARCYYGLGSLSRSLKVYRDYIEKAPEDIEAALEAAWVAEEKEDITEAKGLYGYVREQGGQIHFTRATLSLLRLHIQEGAARKAKEFVDDLDEMFKTGRLPSSYRLNFLYLKGKYKEMIDAHSEAMEIYRKIYQEKPDYKDVEKILENEIHRLDEGDLIERYLNMNRDEFARIAEKIVELKGYKVVSVEAYGPDEVNVSAHDDSEMFKINRVLFAFKRWNQSVAEWPLKEFELELLEKRFDKGVFVSARGFRPSAVDYVEDTFIELMGSDDLLRYLKEALKY